MNWTINKAAGEFGATRESITRGLRAIGLVPKRGACFTTKQIHTAIAGDLKFERVREKRARADLLEGELAEQRSQTFTAEVVHEMIAKAFGAVRQGILMGRAEVPPRANPSDPKTARTAWEAWESRFFPFVRKEMGGEK